MMLSVLFFKPSALSNISVFFYVLHCFAELPAFSSTDSDWFPIGDFIPPLTSFKSAVAANVFPKTFIFSAVEGRLGRL